MKARIIIQDDPFSATREEDHQIFYRKEMEYMISCRSFGKQMDMTVDPILNIISDISEVIGALGNEDWKISDVTRMLQDIERALNGGYDRVKTYFNTFLVTIEILQED